MANLLEGLKLSRKDGTVTPAEDLKGKIIGFYFSAHWCPPCRGFTPELAKFYAEVIKDNQDFEIVFMSFDRDDDQAKSYVEESHGNWLYILPGEKVVSDLGDKFGVEGIPALIIVKPDGTVITKEGRSEVSSQPARAVLSSWKSQI